MKRLSQLLSLLIPVSLALGACQSAQLPLRAAGNPQTAATAMNARSRDASSLQRYYPMEAGRSWTFELSQTQNGQDNSKYKVMNMFTEPLPNADGAEQAVLRRVYPGAAVTPTPSLIKRFGDRIDLSRYKDPAPARLEPLSLQMGLQLPANLPLPAVTRGVNFVTAMQLPLTPGNSWEGRVFQGGTETVSVKGEETVTVPAGTFQALLIEHHLRYDNGKEDYLRYWYAPGVGMVKLYEELTAYFGQWLKFTSTGVLTQYSGPAGH